MKTDEVTEEMVELIEDIVGMGSNAWDCVDPREIIAAVINTFTKDKTL